MALKLESVFGTTVVDDAAIWTYPNTGSYPKGQVLLVTYASMKTNRNFNNECIFEFDNQEVTKVIAENGTSFKATLNQNFNTVSIAMRNAPMGAEDKFAIYTDLDDASPYLFIKIKIIPYT